MVQKKDKRKLILLLSVLGMLLVAVVTVAIIKAVNSDDSNGLNESNQTSSTSDTTEQPATTTEESDKTQEDAPRATSPDTEEAPAIDPATVNTIDIEPMDITVSYVKGAGGFEYEVLRTPSGSQYVEFRSQDLVGTKCTDDQGAFASILENPSSSEGSTIAKSVTVGDMQYGLSLAAANCTSDAEKLQKYQQSFNDAFSLLKKQD
ncbi:MAG: hypothetical protein ACREGE_03425 [Candidatus Microsaccharimonas sp.]